MTSSTRGWFDERRRGRAVLVVEDLRTHFETRAGVVKAVDGVSFSLARGEVMGLVGESGSGKSVTAYSLMGLVDAPAASSADAFSLAARTWSASTSCACAACAATELP